MISIVCPYDMEPNVYLDKLKNFICVFDHPEVKVIMNEQKPGLTRQDMLDMWDAILLIQKQRIHCYESHSLPDVCCDRIVEAIELIKTNIKKCIDPEVK